MVTILCKVTSYGAADNLWRAFVSQGIPSNLLCLNYDKKRGRAGTLLTKKNKDFWLEELKKGDTYTIIVSANTLIMLNLLLGGSKRSFKCLEGHMKEFKNPPAVFWTGTKYRDNYELFNEVADSFGIRFRFALSDLVRLSPENIQLLHTMEYPDIKKKKSKKFTISHSPGSEERSRMYKGTPEIEEGIRLASSEVKFVYDHISRVSNVRCLNRKAKSHIFIDQIETSIGGIGKNGMEAIALDCVTMSSWTTFRPNDFYPPHPVVVVTSADKVRKHIISLVRNKDIYERLKEETIKWKKYISYENTINYIQSVLGDEFRWQTHL